MKKIKEKIKKDLLFYLEAYPEKKKEIKFLLRRF
jgi:hypothetical protein